MAAITWDASGTRFFETGVDHGVLYVQKNGKYGNGVAWNGLINVNEEPSGAEPSPFYADGIKYLNLMSAEEFAASVEAYTYPDEFEQCDGSAEIAKGITIGQQNRSTFGLCYRTLIGNDTEGTTKGYKIHLVYGCLAAPSSKNYQTVNDSPEPVTFSWSISTSAVESVDGKKPTATLIINSTKVDKEKLVELEKKLYGDESSQATLPSIKEIVELVGASEDELGG